MTKYETVLILDGQMDDAAADAEIRKVKTFLEKRCEKLESIHWGKRKLAYPIRHQNYGVYTIFQYETIKNIVAELERGFRINDKVLRYLTLKA